MSDAELLKAVQDIAFYLGAKAPDPKMAAVWHPKVKHIPASAVPHIVERITDECDRMPANIPKLFRALYAEWQASQPQQIKQVDSGGCPYCYDGLLWLIRGTETAVIYCTCHPGNPGHVGRSTLAAMEQRGWRLQDLKKRGATAPRIQTSAEAYSRAAQHGSAFPDPEMFDEYDGPFDQTPRVNTDGLRHPFNDYDQTHH